MSKLMVSFRDESFRLLAFEARNRGITIQELLRAVIVPDWIRLVNVSEPSTESGQGQSANDKKRKPGGCCSKSIQSLNKYRKKVFRRP
jgi:hypothetical protein